MHLLLFSNYFLILVSRLIEKSISSAYDIVRQARLVSLGSSGTSVGAMTTENSSTSGSFIELQKELFQMLAIVGPYLYRDTLLLQKVHYFYLTLWNHLCLLYLRKIKD